MQRLATTVGVMLLFMGTALAIPRQTSAHIPQLGSTSGSGYSSVYAHGPTVYVQLMNSLRTYSFMETDYNNARGHLNDETDADVAANPPYTDVIPGNSPTPDVFIVLAGSAEETYINAAVGFGACSSSTAWGKLYKQNNYGSGTHWHSLDQKICIWPNRIGSSCGGRLGLNGQGLRYQYLTLEHEQAHVLNLDDSYGHVHAALMLNGCGMLELNVGERDAIRGHY